MLLLIGDPSAMILSLLRIRSNTPVVLYSGASLLAIALLRPSLSLRALPIPLNPFDSTPLLGQCFCFAQLPVDYVASNSGPQPVLLFAFVPLRTFDLCSAVIVGRFALA